ncbi:hypothetical protein ACA910_006956 [Epithemia clementina (nom. ined.)]
MASASSVGNVLWHKQSKVNAELFALTYGAMVGELMRDLEKTDKIQEELDRMGHSIGIRCIEEFLAKSAAEHQGVSVGAALKSQMFTDTSELLKASLKMFLGVTAESTIKSDTSYTITLVDNPLTIFVELPEDRSELEYSQLLCGMVRGMLEMLQYDVTCKMTQSQLKGSEVNEMLIDLKQVLQEGAGEDYHDE